MAKVRWFKNANKTMSTIARPDIALSVAEYRWLEKMAKDPNGMWGGPKVNDVLYHLTKAAIDKAMQADGTWTE